ncbi:hypothetical protein, partial [Streptomyces sp. NPDC004658]|uniref:hypothetical protein n=1 Tax=Streptomyces sp. NPDC004658 TaxID=3154672 RepID=UPI0033B5FB7D
MTNASQGEDGPMGGGRGEKPLDADETLHLRVDALRADETMQLRVPPPPEPPAPGGGRADLMSDDLRRLDIVACILDGRRCKPGHSDRVMS